MVDRIDSKRTAQRDLSIDIMKGLAIFFMIAGHVLTILPIAKSFIYSFHMPLFFIVAGWFFRPRALKDRLILDAKRLLLPYVVVLGTIIIYTGFTSVILKLDFSQIWKVLSLFAIPQGLNAESQFLTPVWFLFAIFWSREIMNICFLYLGRWKHVVILCIGLSTALLSKYCPFQLPFAFFQGCAALVYLWIGWFLRGRNIPTSGKICLALVWLLYFPYNGVGMVYNTYNMYPLDVLSAVGGVCVKSLCTRALRCDILSCCNTFLAWAGKCSMGILCVHSLLFYIGIQLVPIDNWLIISMVNIGLCSAITFVCGKIRVTRVLFGL